jgi:hypothetical protein
VATRLVVCRTPRGVSGEVTPPHEAFPYLTFSCHPVSCPFFKALFQRPHASSRFNYPYFWDDIAFLGFHEFEYFMTARILLHSSASWTHFRPPPSSAYCCVLMVNTRRFVQPLPAVNLSPFFCLAICTHGSLEPYIPFTRPFILRFRGKPSYGFRSCSFRTCFWTAA